jgi:hypothetical protein
MEATGVGGARASLLFFSPPETLTKLIAR